MPRFIAHAVCGLVLFQVDDECLVISCARMSFTRHTRLKKKKLASFFALEYHFHIAVQSNFLNFLWKYFSSQKENQRSFLAIFPPDKNFG